MYTESIILSHGEDIEQFKMISPDAKNELK